MGWKMITDSMLKIMQQIKEIDPDYEFITEEDLKECKKEDPSFELTEEDLREALAHRKLLPEIEKIAEIDVNSIKGCDSESDFIIEKIDD